MLKNRVMLLSLVAFTLSLWGCTKVEPGYVGIKVNQYGNQKGVEDFPLQTGRVWFNPFTQDVYRFPTFLQNVVWTSSDTEGSENDDSVTFNSVEGAVVNVDVALSYAFVADNVPALFVAFRQTPEHIRDVYMRSRIRDAFSRSASVMEITDIFGKGKQTLLTNVRELLNTELGGRGIKIDLISFVGALRVDRNVTNSINAAIAATQKAIEAENAVRQAEAEARQRVARAEGEAKSILAVAQAQAEANTVVAQSVTPILVEWQRTQRWDGVLPKVAGSATPFISLDTK